jgi:radical SAM superfamily enzyme YgiQ (UPF0313 family)
MADKILLTHFYYPESGYGEKLSFPPIGPGYIEEFLISRGLDVGILDMGTGLPMTEACSRIAEALRATESDWLGVSLNSICAPRSFHILEKLKRDTGIRIVVGGPHASTKGEEILVSYQFIDYVVRHEGESALYKLVGGEKEDHIENLSFRSGGEIISNPSLYVNDLDLLPWPRYRGFSKSGYDDPEAIGVLTSRGCPHRCGFCQQSSLLGKKWRGRSPVNFLDEISYWADRGKKSFHVLDDMFLANRRRFLEISDLVCRRGLNHLDFISVGGIRITSATKEVLQALKKMGFKTLAFGIESASNRILRFICKDLRIEQADSVIVEALRMGFRVKLFFIVGLPTETYDEAMQTLEYAKKYPVHQVRIFNYIPYENTKLMNCLIADGSDFAFPYEEYMSDFRKFQRIPIFEDKSGMTLKQKERILSMADEIIRSIDDRKEESAATPA